MQSNHERREAAYQQDVLTLMQMKAEFYSDRAAFQHYEGGAWRALTYGELASRVRSLSDYLIESGFTPGDRIAILSESRPEWAVALLASDGELWRQIRESALERVARDYSPTVFRAAVETALNQAVRSPAARRADSAAIVAAAVGGGGPE